ncbi:MAG: hypothetical protein A3G75_14785 [Verrucomicrobia bacterium RIFCSPLOWO2_12_FULL_64_8]|nr:MAG: hypothetical protein A3G75_14785 [Verrucomicrobia bacterium RIFCSPLOWO2_12_FULL_64_8]
MKNPSFPAVAVLVLAVPLAAAPVTQTAAIYAQPDAAAAVIGFLKAGTEPAAAPGITAPAGWVAVTLPGPHMLFVQNKDIGKSLEVHPGAALRMAPRLESPVFATMEADDKTEITGLRGDWLQIKLTRDVTGYVSVGGDSPAPVAGAATPAGALAAPTRPAAALPGGVVSASMTRPFEGVFVPAKRFLVVGPRPPYDYQLNDARGHRIAFLETGKNKLLAAENMGKYLDREVLITGLLHKTPDGNNLVIDVESLQVK